MIANADQIKTAAAAAIEDIIGRRVPLRLVRGVYRGHCPFHDPGRIGGGSSFEVNPDRGTWRCWRESRGGDCASFVREFERLDWPDTLELLAAEVSLPVQYQDGAREARPGPRRADLHEACRQARDWYASQFWENGGKAAREYLYGRGFTPDVCTAWRIGYARGNGVAMCGAPEDALIAAGVLRKPGLASRDQSLYDPLSGRVIIPVLDPAGRPVGFCGRVLPSTDGKAEGRGGAKYVNTSETLLFRKGALLFGYSSAVGLARGTGDVYVLEGQLKALAAQEAGYAAVATGGTAFTTQHAALAARLGSTIYLAFDADDAGVSATIQAASLLRERELDVRVARLLLPEESSLPDELSSVRPREAIGALRAAGKWDADDLMAAGLPVWYEQVDLLPWLVEVLLGDDLSSPTAAQTIYRDILPLVDQHPVPTVQEAERNLLGRLTGFSPSTLRRRAMPAAGASRPAPTSAPEYSQKMTPARLLAAVLLQAALGRNDRDPLWWSIYIDWLRLPAALLPMLQLVGRIKEAMAYRPCALGTAIMAHAPEHLQQLLLYWGSVPCPDSPVDSGTIYRVQQEALRHEKRRQIAAAQARAAQTGDVAPVADAVKQGGLDLQ